ncbi:MAG: hypothetical protein H8D80_00240 [Proteobacteria bacterium]|nr:hypothetical protein [Pseudomonadota bacterium]
MNDKLNDNTFMMFAMKHYDNPQCMGMEEFQEDLNRIKYIKRLFRKYKKNGILRERLIINHIIIFYNVFGVEAGTRILFYKIEEDMHSLLKTFLIFLNYAPETIPETDLVSVALNTDVINRLREV